MLNLKNRDNNELRILSKLTKKKYESMFRTPNPKLRRRTSIKPSDVFKNYGARTADIEDIEQEEALNASIKHLETLGFIESQRKVNNEDVCKIFLIDNALNDVENYLSDKFDITSRQQKINKTQLIMDQYCNKGVLTDYYCKELKYQLEHTFKDIDIKKERDMLALLNFIQNNKTDMYIREISEIVLGNTKAFEKYYRSKIRNTLLAASGQEESNSVEEDYESNKEIDIFSEYHILVTEQEILLKGSGYLSIGGNSFQLGVFPNGLSITSQDLALIDGIFVEADNVLTIENKTAFYRFKNDDYFAVYLGGFATKKQVELLNIIHKFNPLKKYYHFGDIDPYGFEIHKILCESTGIKFDLFLMNKGVLCDKKYKTCCQTLTEADKKKALELKPLDKYQEVMETMLRLNSKLEQEVIALRWMEYHQ